MAPKKKLGEIFVQQGIVSPKTVERVLVMSGRLHKRFGTMLEEMGLITGHELAAALALQYGCKSVCNFARASFPPELLRIITATTALEHLVFPLKLEGGRLHMAVYDPSSTKILSNIAANNEVTIVPYVSPRADIKNAISKHYFGINLEEPARKTVLVAEDDKMALTLLRNILAHSYDVCTAADGMDAFREAVTRGPQVILTDMAMPKLDGFGLLSALQSTPETKAIPVLLISATTTAEAEAKAFEKGFFDFIPKPIKEATILTRVKRAFDSYEQNNYLFMR